MFSYSKKFKLLSFFYKIFLKINHFFKNGNFDFGENLNSWNFYYHSSLSDWLKYFFIFLELWHDLVTSKLKIWSNEDYSNAGIFFRNTTNIWIKSICKNCDGSFSSLMFDWCFCILSLCQMRKTLEKLNIKFHIKF
jgi:hypothetical protein